MAITLKNKSNLSVKISKITDDLENILKAELIDLAAEIDIRTSSGKDIQGASFRPYAESTKRAKRSAKNEGSRQTSPVNLTQTGRMLASFGKVRIQKTKSKITGIIGFSNKAEGLKGKWNQAKRPWFGLSERQITRLLTRLRGK